MSGISPLPASSAAIPQLSPASIGDAGKAENGSFKDLLVDSIREVNAMQQDADHAVEALMSGGDIGPAEVMTAVQKADLAFRLTMQIRNKLVTAYNEIQQIRV